MHLFTMKYWNIAPKISCWKQKKPNENPWCFVQTSDHFAHPGVKHTCHIGVFSLPVLSSSEAAPSECLCVSARLGSSGLSWKNKTWELLEIYFRNECWAQLLGNPQTDEQFQVVICLYVRWSVDALKANRFHIFWSCLMLFPLWQERSRQTFYFSLFLHIPHDKYVCQIPRVACRKWGLN